MVVAPEPLGRGLDFCFALDFFTFGFEGPGFDSRGFTLRRVIGLVLMFDLVVKAAEAVYVGVDLGLGAHVQNAGCQ